MASVFRAKNLDEAIYIANDSRFGLGASAWTNDEKERERLINEIESGMVFINRMVASDPRLPFGGVKWSGYGRELGTFGIREFTDVKTVLDSVAQNRILASVEFPVEEVSNRWPISDFIGLGVMGGMMAARLLEKGIASPGITARARRPSGSSTKA